MFADTTADSNMSDTPAQMPQDATASGGGMEKARGMANSILMKSIAFRLERNPSIDLSHFLRQQVDSYPQLCNRLAQTASQQDSKSRGETSSQNEDKEEPALAAESSVFHLNGDMDIIYPLDGSIVTLASAWADAEEPNPDQLDKALAAGLNNAISNSQTLWRLHNSAVLQIGPSHVVKICTSLDHDGMTNLQYINKYAPDVPAPSCLGALQCGWRTYAFMTRADGVTLETVWPRLLPSHKLSIQQQLNTIFRTIRAKVPGPTPNGADVQCIGGFVSGRCKDMRRNLREAEGPIRDEVQFSDFLCRQPRRTQTAWIRMVRSLMSDDHGLVMTHGDLHPRNIMVQWEPERGKEDQPEDQGRLRVTALIDWEFGGWYPAYWEFVKALSTVNQRGPLADWCDYLPTEAIGKWPVEFSIDLLISRWLG